MTNIQKILTASALYASLLSGCVATPRHVPPIEQTRQELSGIRLSRFQVVSICSAVCNLPYAQHFDETYWIPSQAWIRNALDEYHLVMRECPISRTTRKQWDCNKRARDLQVFLAKRYALYSGKSDPEGIACFLMAYKHRRGEYHSVNLIIIDGRVCFYDVGIRSFIRPTATELKTVFYLGD